MKSSNAPIGIYDSGMGGLSVRREVCRLLPEESVIYLGDGKNCPYGSRSVEEIRRNAGGNTFTIVHRADDEMFNSAIMGMATSFGQSRGVVGGYRESKIHVPNDEQLRTVIARLNEQCDLRSINEVIPSINDIFIRAVNGTL